MLRTFIILAMLFTSFINIALFIAKWIDTDVDTAWKAFEDHVDNCVGKL